MTQREHDIIRAIHRTGPRATRKKWVAEVCRMRGTSAGGRARDTYHQVADSLVAWGYLETSLGPYGRLEYTTTQKGRDYLQAVE